LTKYIEHQRAGLAARNAEGKDTNHEKATLLVLEDALAGLLRLVPAAENTSAAAEIAAPGIEAMVAQSGGKRPRIRRPETPAEMSIFAKLRKEAVVIPRHAGQPSPSEAVQRKQALDDKITMIDRLKRDRLATRAAAPRKRTTPRETS
jgi:hypothetical protein